MKIFLAMSWGFYYGILALLLSVVLFASSLLPQPYSAYIVQSGSMEPAIMTGDIVIDRTDWKPAIDFVVTFFDSKDRLVTHRIIEEVEEDGLLKFRTKGDNNEDPDRELISSEAVTGVWYANLSYLGYLAVWLRRPVVALIVILLPLTLLLTLDSLTDDNSTKKISSKINP